MKQTKPAIEINNLQFSWSDQTPMILDIEQFHVDTGELVFLKGPSGSGKSTLLSLLGGVVLPQHGAISVIGEVISNMSSTQRDIFRANHIGFIFQMFNLLPYLSIIENVLIPLSFSQQRKQKVLRKNNPEEEAMRLLAHLDLTDPTLLEKPVSDLSVGQQQRVAAARSLIGSPDIVIADEPTSSLDTDRRDAFINLLIKECKANQSTLVFVSHDQSLERHFDRSVSLNDINKAAHLHEPQA